MKKNEKVPNFITTQNIPKEFTEMSIKKDSQNNILVSVLVPVYNTAKTLERTLTSCRKQTLKQIEIVCVDDGSDEETKQELARCAAMDERIRVITHEKNKGLLVTRRTGIENARGEYIMFLDSDDELLPQACERAYEVAIETKADIVGFGTIIIFQTQLSDEEQSEVKKTASVYEGTLNGKEVFLECFRYGENKYGWNLWNKLYKKEILCRAAAYIPETHCTLYEDFIIYFMASFFAQTYFGIKDSLIIYSFGNGISGSQKWTTIEHYHKSLDRKTACDCLENFLDAEKPALFYRNTLHSWEKWMIWGILQKFVSECSAAEGAKVFDLLCAAYTPERIILELVLLYANEKNSRIAKLVRGANCLTPQKSQIRRIGFFYHRLYNGGVERVLSELIPLFLQWGYETVLFVEETNNLDYPIPDACKKYIIASSREISVSAYPRHAEDLCNALRETNCDVLLYQSTLSPWFLPDMLLAKSMGIRVIGTAHELISLPLLRPTERKSFATRQYIFRLADGIQTLVRSDAAYLREIGCNAQFIPNPCHAPSEQHGLQNQNILWVGRLDSFQKRPADALLIMKEVIRSCPQAHLYMIGTAENEEENKRYANLLYKYKLEANVTLCGFYKNPDEYYCKGSVLLMTSAYETWGMVLCESMQRGLPIVCYDMPYLETLRGNGGCVRIEQGNITQAAKEIVHILQDKQHWQELSDKALKKAENLASADLNTCWKNFLNGLYSPPATEKKELSLTLENILEFYERGEEAERLSLQTVPHPTPIPPLWKKAAKFWVEHGTFALARRGMLYIYRKLRKNRIRKHKQK